MKKSPSGTPNPPTKPSTHPSVHPSRKKTGKTELHTQQREREQANSNKRSVHPTHPSTNDRGPKLKLPTGRLDCDRPRKIRSRRPTETFSRGYRRGTKEEEKERQQSREKSQSVVSRSNLSRVYCQRNNPSHVQFLISTFSILFPPRISTRPIFGSLLRRYGVLKQMMNEA